MLSSSPARCCFLSKITCPCKCKKCFSFLRLFSPECHRYLRTCALVNPVGHWWEGVGAVLQFGVFGQAAGQESRAWLSSPLLAPCQQPLCMLLSPDKCDVARSAFTDANSNSGLCPTAQVVSGRQPPPGVSLPCLSLYELAWSAGLGWKPPACSWQTLAGGTPVLTTVGAWMRARSSARRWWQPPVAVLRSRLALGTAAAICQALALKMN